MSRLSQLAVSQRSVTILLAFALFVNNVPLEKPADTARAGKTLGKLCEVIYREE